METIVAEALVARPLLRTDQRARMAKADLRKAETPHAEMAHIVADVREASRLNLDEFAREIGKDPRQVKRWESGDERPQIEAVYAVARFKPLVLEAMARQNQQQIEIETVIRIRRSA
jgi:DNA-binding transcriptional regulator YiaG